MKSHREKLRNQPFGINNRYNTLNGLIGAQAANKNSGSILSGSDKNE